MNDLTLRIIYNLKNSKDFVSWDDAVLSAVAVDKQTTYIEDKNYLFVAQRYLHDAFIDAASETIYNYVVRNVLESFLWYIENGVGMFDAMAYSLMTVPVKERKSDGSYGYAYGFRELDDEA